MRSLAVWEPVCFKWEGWDGFFGLGFLMRCPLPYAMLQMPRGIEEDRMEALAGLKSRAIDGWDEGIGGRERELSVVSYRIVRE